MNFCEKLKSGTPTLSFEFFPPKDPNGWGTLYTTMGQISRLAPDYVTVTYGAGGSTRQKTVELVSRIQGELEIETMAHLTCVGHSRGELAEILTSLQTSGITAIMALRGDPPRGETKFTPHPKGFRYASEFIEFIKSGWDFTVGCSFYPEKHPEAESLDKDIDVLKLKQDNGADFAVSQIFFDNGAFYQFRDKAASAGVMIPLVPGLLPVTALAQLSETGICRRSGTGVPQSLLDFLGDDKKQIVERGVAFCADQSRDLLQNCAAGVHFYTLNRGLSSMKVTDALRADGFLTLPARVK